MIALIFITTAIIITALYLWHVKYAEIQISFIKGLMIGASIESPEIDGCTTNYLDLYFGIFIVSFIWDN